MFSSDLRGMSGLAGSRFTTPLPELYSAHSDRNRVAHEEVGTDSRETPSSRFLMDRFVSR